MTLEGNHDEYYNDIVDLDPTDLLVVNDLLADLMVPFMLLLWKLNGQH
jgi:hypothetical protein